MIALVGREVKRTLSGCVRKLPRLEAVVAVVQTDDTTGEEVADLTEVEGQVGIDVHVEIDFDVVRRYTQRKQ